MVVDSCVISASGLVYFIFDCRYLEVNYKTIIIYVIVSRQIKLLKILNEN